MPEPGREDSQAQRRRARDGRRGRARYADDVVLASVEYLPILVCVPSASATLVPPEPRDRHRRARPSTPRSGSARPLRLHRPAGADLEDDDAHLLVRHEGRRLQRLTPPENHVRGTAVPGRDLRAVYVPISARAPAKHKLRRASSSSCRPPRLVNHVHTWYLSESPHPFPSTYSAPCALAITTEVSRLACACGAAALTLVAEQPTRPTAREDAGAENTTCWGGRICTLR